MHPILFKIGSITIYSYGTMVAVAFLLFCYCAVRALKKNPIMSAAQLIDLALYILIAGILGARLFHVGLNLDYYLKKPVEILFLHKGGLAFQGGVISATVFSYWYLRKRRQNVLKVYDFIVPCLALGHSVGRIGCFLNGCCYGISGHPTQLYSALALFAIFLVLRFFYKRKHFNGQIFLLYFILYSITRFFIDFLRADLEPVFLGLTTSQLISIVIFTGTSLFYKWKISNSK